MTGDPRSGGHVYCLFLDLRHHFRAENPHASAWFRVSILPAVLLVGGAIGFAAGGPYTSSRSVAGICATLGLAYFAMLWRIGHRQRLGDEGRSPDDGA